ncbi:ABC transporter G family member 23-like [Triticum dicoccoides]|uniref:ABC transporter G family member 23-like n=1 Tax=Triticum dicoccoides TaxID=85692 RepID=UPI001890B86E|nr:ABC transporter G family member 23-like [Triticum dicoccoides]
MREFSLCMVSKIERKCNVAAHEIAANARAYGDFYILQNVPPNVFHFPSGWSPQARPVARPPGRLTGSSCRPLRPLARSPAAAALVAPAAASPAMLLLDEPTSGLDSGSALHIVKMLRDMATAHGKTVVLTIHQPGFRTLELLDRVVLLADGAVRHHGSLPFLEARLAGSGHSIPAHVNVLEYAMETIDTLKPDVVIATALTYQDVAAAEEVCTLSGCFVKTVLRTPQLFAALARSPALLLCPWPPAARARADLSPPAVSCLCEAQGCARRCVAPGRGR